jgi:hypothetical protein
LDIPAGNEKLIEDICKLFEIKKVNITSFWRKGVLKFKTN